MHLQRLRGLFGNLASKPRRSEISNSPFPSRTKTPHRRGLVVVQIQNGDSIQSPSDGQIGHRLGVILHSMHAPIVGKRIVKCTAKFRGTRQHMQREQTKRLAATYLRLRQFQRWGSPRLIPACAVLGKSNVLYFSNLRPPRQLPATNFGSSGSLNSDSNCLRYSSAEGLPQ